MNIFALNLTAIRAANIEANRAWVRTRKRPDSWTRQAEQGYAARSVYKAERIQRRFRVLNRMKKIVDLGCSWFVVHLYSSTAPSGTSCWH